MLALHPQSLLARAGLSKGDIVRRVNGIELQGPDRFIPALGQLESHARITLKLRRKGKQMTINAVLR